MATTTPNFGWPVPTSTDLVKDGATAIEALGDGVDASLVDLKGGTTGQILAKATNADMDFAWVSNEVGDITAITASSPLTGGGTSGDVTIGILSGTTSNLGAVQLSTSVSSTSTSLAATASAVKEAYDLANNGGPAFRAFRDTSNQSFSASTFTKVQFNAEDFDTASCFDSTTNYRFTPTKAGYYQFNSNLSVNGTGEFAMQIRKNGTSVNQGANDNISALGYLGASVSSLFYMNGSTDYVEVFVFVAGGSPFLYNGATGAQTAFSGVWIRS